MTDKNKNNFLASPNALNKTAAEAKVACPHKGTSHFGVNQRRPKQVPGKPNKLTSLNSRRQWDWGECCSHANIFMSQT